MSAALSIPKKVKGKPSVFFKDPAIDQVMTFFIELLTEVSVLRDRLDTLERVLAESGVIVPDAIETHVHDDASEQRRAAERKALLERVMRMNA
jgi:hypothetical protein